MHHSLNSGRDTRPSALGGPLGKDPHVHGLTSQAERVCLESGSAPWPDAVV